MEGNEQLEFGGAPYAPLLGGAAGSLLGDPFGQRQMTENELADRQFMQGLQLGGQGALHATRSDQKKLWNREMDKALIRQQAKESAQATIDRLSPPWPQEMCVCLAMAVTAAVVYPAIKLIQGVL